MKEKVYSKCLPLEQKETPRVGENEAFDCFCVRKRGGQAGAYFWKQLGPVQLWSAGGEALPLRFLKGMLRESEPANESHFCDGISGAPLLRRGQCRQMGSR